jgi:putative CocE/NonD family hydrolase
MQEPRSERPDTYAYDPVHPVPTTGGRHLTFAATAGPRDQVYVEKRDDVLCYTTTELTEDVEVTGEMEVHLYAATSARDTDFTAQLIDVRPDGRALNIADGVIRARFRKSIYRESSALVTPGECNEYIVRMGLTSYLFKKGHRVRVDVSSSNFPAWDRNMNTGNAIGEDAVGIVAKQTVYHEPGRSSYIDLPVVSRK